MCYHQAHPAPRRALHIAGHVLLGAILGIALAGLFGLAVQYLWNYVMPGLFPVPALSFKQAVALVVLARLLFGRFGGSGRHHGWLRRHHRHQRNARIHGAVKSCRCWSRPNCGCAEAPMDPHS